MKTLLPLYVHPLADPAAWKTVADLAFDEVTVVVNVADGPGPARAAHDPAYTSATEALGSAGVRMIGYVDLGYAARPLADIVDDVARWRAYPVSGIFLDHAPTTPFSVGPVALAVRAARRLGLDDVVLNPGTVPDPVYRDLGVDLCVFEGAWEEYQRWSGHGCRVGDGHLVHGVPPGDLTHARRALGLRGAGFELATDLAMPAPYAALPAWFAPALPAAPTFPAAPVLPAAPTLPAASGTAR